MKIRNLKEMNKFYILACPADCIRRVGLFAHTSPAAMV